MTDYHTKPLLQARVHAESLAWARGEAERRGQAFGDFIDGLIAAERTERAGHADGFARVGLRVTAAETAEEGQP